MENLQNFIIKLTKTEILKAAKEDAIADWGDDIPITILLANIGKKIADHFEKFPADERIYIFSIIESAMIASDIDLKTPVATGLLEALYLRASSDAVRLKEIEQQLGNASREYLVEWRRWSE
ncbi:hypothetical protein PTKU64_80140 [Paraburkholderia terrae]|uniref:DUF5071 domain-containing protein n=2 Tax=Paraburkholderia terrae TaxID=311230 RepID=A0ABN6JUM5_9BURK|nr:hypothetical protein [Paraburkholderia terrae]BCZ84339.1 hypothetical protein PTKU64_80140 [Paraburkholderia terrae]